MYKVKNCPNMVKAVFLRKTRFYEPNDKLGASHFCEYVCQKRVKIKKLVKSSNKDEVKKMTPSDQQQLKAHLKAAAEILYRNTEPTELKSFESIEKSVRQKMLEEVGPELGSFFFQQYQEFKQENPEK
jgi:hypothetical protein